MKFFFFQGDFDSKLVDATISNVVKTGVDHGFLHKIGNRFATEPADANVDNQKAAPQKTPKAAPQKTKKMPTKVMKKKVTMVGGKTKKKPAAQAQAAKKKAAANTAKKNAK